MQRAAVATLALLLTTGVVACGDDDDSGGGGPSVVSVGRVADSDAFAAVVSNGGQIVAYVCDSKDLTAAFRGEQDGDKFDLESGGGRLQGELSDGGASGTFTSAEGKKYDFSTEKASGEAGFYAGRDGDKTWAGWIVLADGQQRGSVGNFKTFQPAPTLNPSAESIRIRGTAIRVFQIQPGMVPGMGMIPGMGMRPGGM